MEDHQSSDEARFQKEIDTLEAKDNNQDNIVTAQTASTLSAKSTASQSRRSKRAKPPND